MKKADRQKIFDKYRGRCAYCGCQLNSKWHVDHIEPVDRKTKLVGGYVNKKTGEPATEEDINNKNWKHIPYKRVPDGFNKPENNCIENMNPACISCNNYKHSMSLETFRQQIGLLVGRLNSTFNQYKIAKRYGLIEETNKEVLFYFEKMELKTFLNDLKNQISPNYSSTGNKK